MGKSKAVEVARQRAVEHTTSKGAVIAGPPAAAGAELLAAMFVHHQWGHGVALPLVSAAIPALTAGCTWAVDRFSRHRSPVARTHSAVTAGAVGAHLLAALIAGPFSHPLIDAWMLGGGGLVVTWIGRKWISSNKEEEQEGRKSRNIVDELFETAEISGVKARKLTANENRAQARLQLTGGRTVDDLQKERKSLAAILGVPGNGVRINEDPDNAGAADMTMVRRNMLREHLRYTEPSLLGGSAAKPVRLGLYEDAEPIMLALSVPGLGESHLIIIGMNGAGKTNAAKVVMGEKFTRRECYTIFVDTVKGPQTLKAMARGLKWVVDTENKARALMRAIKTRVIPYRAKYLGRKGLKEWQSGCGIPRLDIHVEEGAGLFLGNGDFIRAMERCRSVGIHITLSMQRPSYTSMDVAARSQFTSVLAFGVADTEDAAFAMPDDILAAGADPSVWKNGQPGCLYLCDPRLPKDRQTTPGRVEDIADEDLELLAEYAHEHSDELDAGTIEAFGKLYTDRITGDMILAQLGADPVTVDGEVAADEDTDENEDVEDEIDDTDEVEQAMAGLDADERAENWTPPADDPAAELQPDLDEEIRPIPTRITFGTPVDESKVTPEQAAAIFDAALEELRSSGVEVIRGRDMTEVAAAAQRSVPWIHKQLKQRVDAGVLERTDAGYAFADALVAA